MPGQGRDGPRGLVRHRRHGPRTFVREALRREVRRLLARGHKRNAVARALGVSYGVVDRIYWGESG